MDSTRQLTISILITIAIIMFGSWGFMAIEGWNFLDALYMTVITLATVGFTEVLVLSPVGR
ncbi:MAG: ion channel, partial [Desulfatirhabdiaceae bacterium]|nr:ion channel [Desulfatirhabdiaceae bacterium]